MYLAAYGGAVGHDAAARGQGRRWAALTSRKMVARSLRAPEPATCQVNTVSRAAAAMLYGGAPAKRVVVRWVARSC